MIVNLLVAAAENNVIGKDNALPWHLPSDMKYFKNQTWGMPVIMGRKTFDSLAKALKGRNNIVLTRQANWKADGVTTASSLEEAIAAAAQLDAKEVFVIGGAEIFQLAWETANKIYLTRIHHEFEGDAFFPALSNEDWRLVKTCRCEADGFNAYAHSFEVWERNTSDLLIDLTV